MSVPAIEIESIQKRYGRFEALKELSLTVPAGSVFGLLGPNGAGKSTLVKSLLTIVRPTLCRGTLLGKKIGHRPTLAKVGYLPEHAKFPDYLTGRQIVSYSARMTKVVAKQATVKTEELLELVGMGHWADKRNGTYSKGMRQRVGLAQALVNDPEIVFLDEPTDGVDPEGRVEIRGIIEKMRDQGRTVFVNSHLLAEVEAVADEVAILAQGKIVERGRTADLVKSGSRFIVRALGPVPFELKAAFEREGAKVAGDRVECECEDAKGVQGIIDALRKAGVVVREVIETRTSLEEVFMRAIRQSKGGES
ncbi:MAG: ABC transporter ATP-binding protein [Akkermansiaceae bacterium]|nr:ABC transporter ATP-binding protein [Akkermansiaceae bacterium]